MPSSSIIFPTHLSSRLEFPLVYPSLLLRYHFIPIDCSLFPSSGANLQPLHTFHIALNVPMHCIHIQLLHYAKYHAERLKEAVDSDAEHAVGRGGVIDLEGRGGSGEGPVDEG